MQEITNSCGCSRQTISNYCKKLIYNSEERVITKEDCIVYVAVDSTFTHMNRKKGRGLEVKTLVLWTNMESINNSKLSDLSLIHVTKENSDNIYGLIKEKASIRYPEYRAIKVVGDGAVWIKNLGESFDGFYLDKFHYMNAVQSLISSFTGRNKKILSIISDISKKIVYENAKDENPMKSLEMMLRILNVYMQLTTPNDIEQITNINTGEIFKLESQDDIERILKMITKNKLFNYIRNNWKYFKRTCEENIKNPVEAIQSHYVNSIIRRKWSSNSSRLTAQLLSIKFAMINQFRTQMIINNPLFSVIDPQNINFKLTCETMWYNKSQVTGGFVSRNIYSNVFKTPRFNSNY